MTQRPDDVTDLVWLADELLADSLTGSAGRASKLVHGGSGSHLRQTMMALRAGHGLGEHNSPDDATLHVLRGRVLLKGTSQSWEVTAGSLVDIPPERHSLDALEDSVVLLTTLLLPA